MTPVLAPLEELETAPEFVNSAGQLIPDPLTYSEWFAGATEPKRRLAVGARRYATVADKLDREPAWEDFVDPETGQLVPTDRLADESADEHAERIRQVLSLFGVLRLLLGQTFQFGFPVGR